MQFGSSLDGRSVIIGFEEKLNTGQGEQITMGEIIVSP